MPDLQTRRRHCTDTLKRTPAIVHSTPGASLSSTFIPSQLRALTTSERPFPALPLAPITIHNSDAFALARSLSPSTGTGTGKIGVLNLASDQQPGGGWVFSLCQTQEEALCYSSTLYATLKPEWYPWDNRGPNSCAGIFSPAVAIFKDTLDNQLEELPEAERRVVAVMTVAAPRGPKLTDDGEAFAEESTLEELRERILLVLRMAARNGVTQLVLGAMGCGVYMCPPRVVAVEMKRAIEREEFEGWFERVVFAVYADGRVGQKNLEIFKEVFEG